MANAKSKTIVVKLPAPMAAKIVSAAKARGITKSEVVRSSLEQTLADDGDPLEDIADLIGSVAGPRDLSTNKKHLRGYGTD